MIGAVDIPADMTSALRQLDIDAEEIVSTFVREIEASPLPPRLYHYTNDDGLRGILESGKLWLSDIFSLNDPSELSHSVAYATDILKGKAKNSHEKAFASRFDQALTVGELQNLAHYFVCSFSASHDDLGQWRAYADDGRGYALEFDTSVLDSAFCRSGADSNVNNHTARITYNDNTLIKLYEQVMEMALPLIVPPNHQNFGAETIDAYTKSLLVTLARQVIPLALLFKHEAYKNENEIRFFQVYRANEPAPNLKYRKRSYSLVRYREFSWKTAAKGALKRIVIGPAADTAKSIVFANDCLREFHSEPVDVIHSPIPYRSVR